jgi:hypothetical protein
MSGVTRPLGHRISDIVVQPRRRGPEDTRPPPLRDGVLERDGPAERDGALIRGAEGRLIVGGAERDGLRGAYCGLAPRSGREGLE